MSGPLERPALSASDVRRYFADGGAGSAMLASAQAQAEAEIAATPVRLRTDEEAAEYHRQRSEYAAVMAAREAEAAEHRRQHSESQAWASFAAPARHRAAEESGVLLPPPKWTALSGAVMAAGAIVAIIGGRGTGKTQMATSLAREWIGRGGTAAYWRLADLYDEIKATFDHLGLGNKNAAFRVTEALPIERDEPALATLPRLAFKFNQRDQGGLRLLINYLNNMPA